MPQISVIIPVYNKISYLAAILEDVRIQSFGDFECILIDDGSTDGSGTVCDQFARKDNRFLVYHIPNGGVSHARNVGLEHAQGVYLTFIDGDDRIYPDYLKNLYDCIRESSADMVISGVEKLWTDTQCIKVVSMPYHGHKRMDEILKDFAQVQQNTGIYGCCVAKLFTHALVKELRFDENLRLAEDFDFYLQLYSRIQTIWFDEEHYYTYLQAAENSSALVKDSQIDYLAQLKVNLRYRRFLQDTGAYAGENQKIINRILSNYCYFTLFHTSAEKYTETFREINDLWKRERIPLNGERLLQKWLFYLMRHNYCALAEHTMEGYRALRRIIRKR